MTKHRLFSVIACALILALAFPMNAFAYNWVKSPVSPIIRGGVHSEARFQELFLTSAKVIGAVKAVLKADKVPSWVYPAAVAKVQAGEILSGTIARGTKLGAMAFGPKKTRVVKNTIWKGNFRLPYYYVEASNDVYSDGWKITTTYKVCLAQTCANPFAFGKTVRKIKVSPPDPEVYGLYVEKRLETTSGALLGGWEVTGTVNGVPVSAITTDAGPVLVGNYEADTPYDLSELLQEGWEIVSPEGGRFTGVMPAGDLTLTFVNRQILLPPPPPPSNETSTFGWTKGFWHNKNGMSLVASNTAWIDYVNTLDPYKTNPFDGLDAQGNPVPAATNAAGKVMAGSGTALAEIAEFLVASNGTGDAKLQMQEQLLAFIFNMKNGAATEVQLADGSWVTVDEFIASAVTAWNTGGSAAQDWIGILGWYNADVWINIRIAPPTL